jgi:elongation factor 3
MATCLAEVLKRADDKDAGVREAAVTAVKTGLKVVPANSVRMVCRVLFENLSIEAKWRVKEAALIGLCALADDFDKQINAEIPTIIGTTNELLWDTRDEVAVASLKAIEAVVDVIANRDIDTSRPAIISSMKNQDECPEMIQTLASVTFVQTVDEGTLGLLCPLLMKGFLVPNTSVKRQCAVIISNMAKLVESPADAAPFLEILLPALDRAADEIADPEARKVTTKARDQLLRIQAAAKAEMASNAGQDPAFVRAMLDKAMGADKCSAVSCVTEFAVGLITSLVHLQIYDEDEWKEVTPYLALIDAGKAASVTSSVLAELKQVKAIKPVGGDEDDDTPVLYDGKFTLAYGSKILLHNTELNLRVGHKYGLLGGNDSGKTSLMRAIANASIEGFPKRTCFVPSLSKPILSVICRT